VCATLAFASLPGAAFAASSASIAASVRAKKAQAASVEAQLKATGTELVDALAKSDQVDAQLQDVRDQITATSDSISQLEAQIAAGQAVLNDRAVAMYKSGGLDMLEALLSVNSLDDLMTRIDMLAYIQQTDAELLNGLTTARDQSAFLAGQQAQRENDLIALRQESDARTALVQSLIAQQQSVLKSIGSDVANLVKQEEAARSAEAAAAAGNDGVPAPPVPFQADTLISEAKYTDSGSLAADGIQAFLEAQGGALKSYAGHDHSGVSKTAAQMIADAASAWGVSPKVILVTLQKEQSLLTDHSPSQRALDWAMGCGKMDGSTLTQYQGFGNQIWGGARALSRNRSNWHAGISLTIDGTVVRPSSSATYSLYRYTPHLHGATLFWRLYWRYFGDPTS
jgi:peptidoglycan hydrolase CwlO-like protein